MTYTVQVQLVRLGSFLCWLIGWFCSFSTNTTCVAQDSELANLVVFHAKIHTMDSTRPIAQAIALRGNRILQVGDDDAIRTRIGPQTKTIDAQGRLVLPGFNDSHVHFLQGGQQLSSVQLRTSNSQADFLAGHRTAASRLDRCSHAGYRSLRVSIGWPYGVGK